MQGKVSEKLKKFPKTLLIYMVFLFAVWSLMELVAKPMIGDTPYWKDTLINAGIKTLFWAVPALVLVMRANSTHQLSMTPKELFCTAPQNMLFAFGAAAGLIAYMIIGNIMRNDQMLAFKEIIPGGSLEGPNQVSYSTLFSSVIVASITEEIVFRGLCYNMLAKVWGQEDANWVTALLFTLIHIPRWIKLGLFSSFMVIPNLCYIFVLGMLFGMVLRKTRSIWPPIVMHMLNNVLAEILAFI